jgi:3-oxoacyl-[acyl-carrier protein] reductase
MDLQLDGRTALVGGASSGLGLAIAEALRQEGANVVAVARGREALETAAARIGAVPVAADLSSPEGTHRAVEKAVERFGGLDVLVWNTGGPPPGSALDIDEQSAQAAVQSDLLSLVRIVRLAVPHLRRGDLGRIIAVTATSAREPVSLVALSSLIRPGLTGYLKTIAHELAADGITVNCVAPGRIATPRVQKIYPDGVPAAEIAAIPMRRFGTPAEFAAVVAFLASPVASYVTGTTVMVDGGMTRSLF